jgi:sulfite dehydrogenase
MKAQRRFGLASRLVLYAGLCAALAVALPAGAQDDARLKLGKELFSTGALPACAVCHTLKDAGAEGAVGPVLDELKPDAARVAKALRDGIGQMPSYRATLNDEQIAALAAYVSKVTGAAR